MKKIFIGRKQEKELLQNSMQSLESELVVVVGRRRVGKTYLVRSFYGPQKNLK